MAEMEEGQGDFLVLVDRAHLDEKEEGRPGPRWFKHGRERVWRKGQQEMVVARDTALFILQRDQRKYWTTDGVYTCRYGIKDAPEDVIRELGGEGQNDCTPIEIDWERVEQWEIYRTVPVQMVRANVGAYNQAIREHTGGATAAVVGSAPKGV